MEMGRSLEPVALADLRFVQTMPAPDLPTQPLPIPVTRPANPASPGPTAETTVLTQVGIVAHTDVHSRAVTFLCSDDGIAMTEPPVPTEAGLIAHVKMLDLGSLGTSLFRLLDKSGVEIPPETPPRLSTSGLLFLIGMLAIEAAHRWRRWTGLWRGSLVIGAVSSGRGHL